MRFALTIVVAPLLALASTAGEIPIADPGSVGMSGESLERITAATQQFVDEGKLAGVLAIVAREGRIVHVSAVGQRGVDDDRPLTPDALHRIYSMTKPITSVAVMMLYEEGRRGARRSRGEVSAGTEGTRGARTGREPGSGEIDHDREAPADAHGRAFLRLRSE